MALLKGINVWDDVIEIYNNWNKYRKSSSTTKKKVKKKTENKTTTKSKIKKIISSLSEDELNELKNQLS